MSDKGVQGTRVADAIGVIKWLLISAVIVWAGGSMLVIEFSTAISRTWLFAVATAAAAVILGIWVLLGWFEHSLRALVSIAQQTQRTADGVEWKAPGFPLKSPTP